MFADKLALALPAKDVNGDTFEFIARDRVFDELHGLINPIKDRFVSVEHFPGYPPEKWLTNAEEIQAGRARLIADLNTDEGRAAFLQCWWPRGADGFCLAVRGTNKHENKDGLPYPTFTLLRCATLRHLIAPDTIFDVMRLGVLQPTTTIVKGLWDCGIRRLLWHPTPNFDAWMKEQIGGLSPRLIPLDPDDPLRTWEFAPGHPEKKTFTYFLNLKDRPVTDSYMDWLSGAQ
jgi:hypothetical protein